MSREFLCGIRENSFANSCLQNVIYTKHILLCGTSWISIDEQGTLKATEHEKYGNTCITGLN
jgi:hypothetical protein